MRVEDVTTVIDEIRPVLHLDGGDLELCDADAATGVVTVRLVGACAGCANAGATLRAGVERILRDRVPGLTAVVEAATGIDGVTGAAAS